MRAMVSTSAIVCFVFFSVMAMPSIAQDKIDFTLKNAKMDSSGSVTFSARYITLLEALELVTTMTDTKYEIKKNYVIIRPENDPDSELVMRTYEVDPSLIIKLREVMGIKNNDLMNTGEKLKRAK